MNIIAIDVNLSEGITFGISLINQSIAIFMTPPLAYAVAIGFLVIGMSVVWRFLKPHRR